MIPASSLLFLTQVHILFVQLWEVGDSLFGDMVIILAEYARNFFE